jgi:hypothetical protein
MYDIHDRGIHGRGCKILICAHIQLSERLAQFLRLLDVHRDKLQYAVLCDDTDDHSPVCFVVAVDDWYTPGARFKHLTTCFVYGAVRVNRDCFYRLDSECLLDVCGRVVNSRLVLYLDRAFLTSQAVKAELVYPGQRVWVLPVVLDNVDVVRSGEKAGESG